MKETDIRDISKDRFDVCSRCTLKKSTISLALNEIPNLSETHAVSNSCKLNGEGQSMATVIVYSNLGKKQVIVDTSGNCENFNS